jgi:hypothetical protein
MRRPVQLFLALGVAFTLALAGAGAASARVPQGFVGMDLDGPLFPTTVPGVDISHQMDKMVAAGVESIRVVFDWAAAQPYEHWRDVPPADASQFTNSGGVPTRFAQLDGIVGLAAAHGLTVLPVVIYAPGWDAAPHRPREFAAPKRNKPYGAFIAALIHRYGPTGTFWTGATRKVPIRMWQIWNEPNIRTFWPLTPISRTYMALVRAAHTAIKAADPHAKVVLGGMPNFSWVQLSSLYKVPGARRQFDVVAVHPYTAQPSGVITILKRIRNVMDSNGDRSKPILADEVSWPSSLGKVKGNFDIATTEKGQAKKIGELLPLLAHYRRSLNLLGFDYYTWAGVEKRGGNAFAYSGLFRFAHGSFIAKPAFGTFRRAALSLEACRTKGPVATVCSRPG